MYLCMYVCMYVCNYNLYVCVCMHTNIFYHHAFTYIKISVCSMLHDISDHDVIFYSVTFHLIIVQSTNEFDYINYLQTTTLSLIENVQPSMGECMRSYMWWVSMCTVCVHVFAYVCCYT